MQTEGALRSGEFSAVIAAWEEMPISVERHDDGAVDKSSLHHLGR